MYPHSLVCCSSYVLGVLQPKTSVYVDMCDMFLLLQIVSKNLTIDLHNIFGANFLFVPHTFYNSIQGLQGPRFQYLL